MQHRPYAPYPLNLLRDRLHRHRQIIRLVIGLVLAFGLGPSAYHLWNLRSVVPLIPPTTLILDPGLNIPPPEVDRTKDLLAAITGLPTEPTTGPTTAPAGQRWVTWRDYRTPPADELATTFSGPGTTAPSLNFDPTVVLDGPWLSSRFHLSEVVRYLEMTETRKALDSIWALSAQPHCVENSAFSAGVGGLASIRQAAKLLVARSRYRLVEQHDFFAAADDIEATLQLAAGAEDDGVFISMLVSMACRCLVLEEVIHWCREDLLTSRDAQDMLRRLQRHHFDRHAAWRIAVEGEQRTASPSSGPHAPRPRRPPPGGSPGRWPSSSSPSSG